MFIRAVRDIEFWRERLRDLKDPIKAIIENFDWEPVDKFHLSAIRKHIQPHETLLDIGCGPGRITQWFTPEQYTGMDFVPEFIEEAKKRNPKHTFVIGDLLGESPFKENEFDWGLLISVKGTLFNGDPEDPTNTWRPIEPKLKKICGKLLVLEYSRFFEEII